ncbi:archaetidylserine decarboxylase [Achromobacter mucicolens]|uniref:Phosphatidylserine decarboxylase proenzyme n=1 Tax=Achromobacter mucicolens TaxID=1389922 RepID=A0ABD4YR79_9BURK|nr:MULTISPECIES: archaetidylserine decarboxylase [Achromobacter]OAE54578.1 phosphatidylserine decarboxylase [Achromobacter xylosoxidans]MCP2513491.1 archaetidylserine decarboxylase [Achromobacter mucicolens]MCU6616854.1 archaetidylserine decarboxylase [Achromobacter mucicolens]MDH0091361.1 archaetidylserine decarboxylase [Achromobacter mucicolens]MDH1177780.1 archaetidylserine decarboxylase [Achromobacter mucicolens]
MPIKDQLFLASQYLAPHHLVSRFFGYASDCREPAVKNWMISRFVRKYGVNMSEALQEDPLAYDCFNDFFTRALKDGARPLDEEPGAVVCPADGAISQMGAIEQGRIFQAKGHSYGLADLLGGDTERAAPFQGGQFATIYLSPKDYHRVHMPVAGTLREMIHVPGRLFSVNPLTARNVPRLFARNERVVCIFDTEHGPMAVVLVGAMIVASIETVWAGLVTPYKRRIKSVRYDAAARAPIHLEKGAEMGRFKLGSTAIVLFGPDKIRWADTPSVLGPVRMGELLALPVQV